MPEAVTVDDLGRWRECHDCGLFQRLPSLPDGEAAVCARCDALLRRVSTRSILFARINAVTATLLFLLALTLPLVGLDILGRSERSTVFSGPRRLDEHGMAALAYVVLITLVLVPACKLAIELTVLFGVRLARVPRWLPWLFGWLEHVSPWAMVEVFLLGGVVAYSRLEALARVEVGPAALALGGAMLSMVAIDATLDREAVWQELDARSPQPEQQRRAWPRSPGSLASPDIRRRIGCGECRRVVQAAEGERCPRCSHRLVLRKGSPRRAWALLVTAAVLYIPANALPVMTYQRLGKGGPTTIIHGVVELAQSHLWPLALLVLMASIVVPVFKFLSLATILVMTRARSARLLVGRTRLFRFVRFVGRWSMIDIFMLSVLVGVVQFGKLAIVLPGMGAVAFCAVVLVTMAATEQVDPRRIWDAAGREEEAVVAGGAA